MMMLVPAMAQYGFRHPSIFYYPPMGLDNRYQDPASGQGSFNPGLFSYYLNTGMSFNSLNGFNSVSSWVSPKALLPITSRLSLEVGATFLTTSFTGGNDDPMTRYNDVVAFARGIYSVNPKLTLYGEVERSLMKSQPWGRQYESMTFGMEYFITPNLRFGASFTSVTMPDITGIHGPYPGAYRLPVGWY